MIDESLATKKVSPLQTLADISHVITSSHDAEETLLHTAQMIAERIQVDACSIYVYDKAETALVLRATFGLNPEAIGNVKMHSSEGLSGLVLETAKPVQIADMKSHPRFKYFPETNEESYASFLGVPLIEHRKAFGVLVMHTLECRKFTQEEENILVTIASQISGLISKALLMDRLGSTSKEIKPMTSHRITGTPVASGVALGKAVLMQKDALEEPEKQPTQSPEEELGQFHAALEKTITGTLELIDKVSEYIGPDEAAIFHAHLMFLEDHGFQAKTEDYIKQENSAAWSIFQVIQEYLSAFESIADPYLRERGADLKDMGYRLLHNIGYGHVSSFDQEGILVTKQLLPGDVAHLDPKKIKGIITATGGALSHASILARSRFIPAVCISEDDLEKIKEGDVTAVDGKHGYVILNPGEEVCSGFERLLDQQKEYLHHLDNFKDKPCTTKDGTAVTVLANIGLLSDTDTLSRFGAQGIGLYRTEVYFLSLDRYPTVSEQVDVYSKVVGSVTTEDPIIFRTLDIGADKSAPYMSLGKEENPFMGNRAIRQQIENPEPLKEQIKAILLAAKGRNNVQLLFPMICQLTEIRFAKSIYQECRQELLAEGEEVPELKIGIMFEIPAAMVMHRQFVPEVDFLSIGSNDLTQYVLAVDRNNPHVAHLYDPLDPAVLILLSELINYANENNKPIELCGEMASDPDGCIILVGLGLRNLSMNSALIPVVKERLSCLTVEQAETLADHALMASSAQEVRENISSFFDKLPKQKPA